MYRQCTETNNKKGGNYAPFKYIRYISKILFGFQFFFDFVKCRIYIHNIC